MNVQSTMKQTPNLSTGSDVPKSRSTSYTGQTMTAAKPDPNASVVRDENVTPFQLLDEFRTGTGPTTSIFLPDNLFTRQVQKMDTVENVRQEIAQKAASGQPIEGHYDFSLGDAEGPVARVMQMPADGYRMLNPHMSEDLKNPAATFLGSYQLYVTPTKIDRVHRVVSVDFHLRNTTSDTSLHRNPVTGPNKGYQSPVQNPTTGPYRSTNQHVFWSEKIPY